MEVDFRLPLKESPDLKLVQSIWTGQSRVFVDGDEVPGRRKGRTRTFRVTLRNGRPADLQLKNSGIDVLPRASVVHGDPPQTAPVTLARPLTWWEYLLCGLPLLLIPVGGLVGGVIGALAAYYNLRVMRSNLVPPIRAVAAIGVLFMASVVYVLVALALTALGIR